MQLQRTIIDELRTLSTDALADKLTIKMSTIEQRISKEERIANGYATSPHLKEYDEIMEFFNSKHSIPTPNEIVDDVNELTRRIEGINSLADKFVEEMRQNVLNVPKGTRLNAYAVDCCNFIDSCTYTPKILSPFRESFKNESHKLLKLWSDVLYNLSFSFRIGRAIHAVEEYFPNTYTVEREAWRRDYEYKQAKGSMSDDEYLEPIKQKEQVENEQEIPPEKGLSAVQKLLLIRLLQKVNLFPSKPINTDKAPELKAIALITGLDYVNEIKGGKGAKFKVDQLLDVEKRKSITKGQLKQKFIDLDEIEKVAQYLNVNQIAPLIQEIRAEIEQKYQS
ncbi:hypothetical protein [Spirosoma areae]